MVKKKVTLSIETKTYNDFQKYCEENAIMLSKKIEILMEKILKSKNKNAFLVFGFALMLILMLNFAFAGNFVDKTSNDFSNGIFNLTFYNSSGFLQLNNSIPGNNSINITNGSEIVGNEQGLISYWRFNESFWNGTLGEVKDVLGKNNGTGKSSSNTSDGLLGRAGNFSGTSGIGVNEVQITNKEELNPINNSFTITGWAKSIQKGGAGQWQLYIAKRDNGAEGKNGYYIGLLEGSGLNFAIGDGTTRNDTRNNNSASNYYINVSYNQWFHFAGVVDRNLSKILLYVNGSLGALASISGIGNINNSWNLTIGNDEGQAIAGYNYPVKGQTDEVALWNRALNASEILALYLQGRQNITNSTINGTDITSGTYESSVKDAGSIVQWKNVSWNGLQISANGITDVSNSVLTVHLNESSGKIIDSSAYSNNGTNYGATYNASGKSGSALSFEGVNDYVDFGNPNHLQIIGNITLAAWIKFNQIPSGTDADSIICKNEAGGYGILANEQTTTGRLVTYFYIGGAYKKAGVDLSGLSANTWYHVLATYNGTAVDFYLNGAKKESVAATGAISNIAFNLTIGANPGAPYVDFFNGTIDEVYIFNRSLNSSEIANLYGSSNLRFKAKTSNDNITWSEYKGSDGTANTYYSSPGSLNLSNSRYLQYKTYFDNSDAKLYNVSIDYDVLTGLTVSLDSPSDNYLINQYNGINITCYASSTSQLVNVTSYYSKFGWGASETTREISGTSNTTTFTLNEITSTILWNCLFCNSNGNCNFASSNKTIIGDISVPTISLVSPEDNYIENSTWTISLGFNASDNRATSLDCKLFIDDIENVTNSSVVSGINTNISTTLSNGNHSWKINCSDGINYGVSESRNIVVNFFNSYTPFWAKTNTHTHTTGSDGDSSPTTVINLYKNLSYNIILITDHNTITDGSVFDNLTNNFMTINSEEWTPGSGTIKHVIRVNVSSHVATGTSTDAEVQNAMTTAFNEGGFTIAAHPNWTSTIWSVSSLGTFENYTAMEIYNKVIERLSPDPYSVKKWDSVLTLYPGKKIFGVAVDDMHQVNVDLGYGWTKVYMPEFTKQAYIDSMETGYFYSSQGPNMDNGAFQLACDGTQNYHMGETANCSAINVNATISASNSSFVMRNITLVKNGNIINITTCSTQNCYFNYSENVSSSGYYRLEAIDSNNKYIWSNPIWVNKIALPVTITINSPENNSYTSDYTPLINVGLNQLTSLWYNLNNGINRTLCNSCSSYSGYFTLIGGWNNVSFFANNSDNIVKKSILALNVNFNNSISENFSDNSSVMSLTNAFWNNGKISLDTSNTSGSLILKPIITTNNITSLTVQWLENNTENAKGEGQINPVRFIFGFGSYDYELTNRTTKNGINSNNLSMEFLFDKNNNTPIDLLNYRISWTEFTIPLISDTSASSVTSSSAVISWTTDILSNSSLLYGISSSLGSSISLNDSVASNSISLTGLNPSTGYFYKVKSCTASSCAQDPQEPFTPYSFTTQSSSITPPSGGSSGGGSGGGSSSSITIIKKGELEISDIGNIVVHEGDKKSLSLNAKNIGKIFLNNCRLIFISDINSWFYSNQIDGIAPGENKNFIFDLNVPEGIDQKDYSGEVELKCDEISQASSFSVSIPKNSAGIEIKEIKQEKNNLKINYVINTESDNSIDIWLVDKDGKEIKRIKDSGKGERNAVMKLPGNLVGIYSIYFAPSSDLDNFVKQSIVLGKSSTTGFTILDQPGNKLIGYIIFLIIIGAGVFFIVRSKNKEAHKSKHRSLFSRKEF